MCFSAATLTDVQLSGKVTKGVIKAATCCGYGSKGTKTAGDDCLVIPNLTTVNGATKPPAQCGGKGGLVTASGTTSKTVCSKFYKPTYKLSRNWVFFDRTRFTEKSFPIEDSLIYLDPYKYSFL